MIKLPWFTLSIIFLLFGSGFLLLGAAFSTPCETLLKAEKELKEQLTLVNPTHGLAKNISCAYKLNYAGGGVLTALGTAFAIIGVEEKYQIKHHIKRRLKKHK